MGRIERFMYFYEVRKIFWISLRTRNSKTKQKAFAKRCGGMRIASLLPHYL